MVRRQKWLNNLPKKEDSPAFKANRLVVLNTLKRVAPQMVRGEILQIFSINIVPRPRIKLTNCHAHDIHTVYTGWAENIPPLTNWGGYFYRQTAHCLDSEIPNYFWVAEKIPPNERADSKNIQYLWRPSQLGGSFFRQHAHCLNSRIRNFFCVAEKYAPIGWGIFFPPAESEKPGSGGYFFRPPCIKGGP